MTLAETATAIFPGVDHFDPAGLASRYREVRSATLRLCEPLETEDFVVQSMPDTSPTKWHLAHTTWFFEVLVLCKYNSGYKMFCDEFNYLFNSYYNTVGPQYFRPNRGLISRPTTAEVFAYREHVDGAMMRWLADVDGQEWQKVAPLVEIGLHHEQQHQELVLTDIKHAFACNPLHPTYRREGGPRNTSVPSLDWVSFEEGMREIGHEGEGFAYDNERPRHRLLLPAFDVANRLVTNGEYLDFIEDGGYECPELWLSDAWNVVREEQWRAPLYWRDRKGEWRQMTLAGERELRLGEPVCHVSFYEADAYARWAGARLPAESEWETAAASEPLEGNFLEEELFHPAPASPASKRAFFGDVWEWTASPYGPYPRYSPPEGPLGEYNAKFMVNQLVLRGGSCATPRSHIRSSYRNFFPPPARWQFSGIRLARDGGGSPS